MAVWPRGLIQRELSNRAVRYAELKPKISVFWGTVSVCGACKVWYQTPWDGLDIAVCTTARLMKNISILEVMRGMKPKMT